jgi:hypothetical protein
MTKEKFQEMYLKDLTGMIETVDTGKRKLSYISWANAYKMAMEQDPSMSYEILEDLEGFPLFSRGDCHFVKTTVTMFGVTKKMMLPIMDNRHNSISKPNSRDINDSIMRCLVKNIAMFGIGLSLYTGEDLEKYKESKEDKEVKEVEERITPEERAKFIEVINKKYSKEDIDKAIYLVKENGRFEFNIYTASKKELNYLKATLRSLKTA